MACGGTTWTGSSCSPPRRPIMGYCLPAWISDYTFEALLMRIQFVNQARIHVPAELQSRLYDRALVDQDGSVTWLDPLRLPTPPAAQTRGYENLSWDWNDQLTSVDFNLR